MSKSRQAVGKNSYGAIKSLQSLKTENCLYLDKMMPLTLSDCVNDKAPPNNRRYPGRAYGGVFLTKAAKADNCRHLYCRLRGSEVDRLQYPGRDGQGLSAGISGSGNGRSGGESACEER